MKKIIVNWNVTQSSGTEGFTLDELNIGSEREWELMSDYEQECAIQDALDGAHLSYPIVVSWK